MDKDLKGVESQDRPRPSKLRCRRLLSPKPQLCRLPHPSRIPLSPRRRLQLCKAHPRAPRARTRPRRQLLPLSPLSRPSQRPTPRVVQPRVTMLAAPPRYRNRPQRLLFQPPKKHRTLPNGPMNRLRPSKRLPRSPRRRNRGQTWFETRTSPALRLAKVLHRQE